MANFTLMLFYWDKKYLFVVEILPFQLSQQHFSYYQTLAVIPTGSNLCIKQEIFKSQDFGQDLQFQRILQQSLISDQPEENQLSGFPSNKDQKGELPHLNWNEDFFNCLNESEISSLLDSFQEVKQKLIQNKNNSLSQSYISSLEIDKKTKRLTFNKTVDGGLSRLKHRHIGTPLKAYCVNRYPYDISFSLNPNPDEKISGDELPKTQVKWYSVDQYYKTPLLGKTRFGNILFEADYVMKQLTLGIDSNNQKFVYPEDLAVLFDKKMEKEGRSLSRFFLKVNPEHKVIQFQQDHSSYKLKFTNPKIQVEARNMVIKNGKLIDEPIQDQKSQCYRMAKTFSENYEIIAYYYPIFNELKGAIIGMALAKWIQKENIHLSNTFIERLYESDCVQKYERVIPFLNGVLSKQESISVQIFMDSTGGIVYGNSQIQMEDLIPIGASKQIAISQSIISVSGGFDGTLASSIFQTNQLHSLLSSEKFSVLSSISNNFSNAFDTSKKLSPKLGQNQFKQQQINMITKYEVTNKEYYDKKLSSPIYPGNGSKTDKSGVTIAIGYDLGHINKEQFRQDFKDILPENQIKLLEQAIGLKGPTAKKFIQNNKKQLGKVKVSYQNAVKTFEVTIKKYEKKTDELFPGVKQKCPHTYNSLVSMVYNRGHSLKGQTRREMKEISDVAKGKKALPAGESFPEYAARKLREMKRLWVGKNLPGLLNRRQNEARNCLKDLDQN